MWLVSMTPEARMGWKLAPQGSHAGSEIQRITTQRVHQYMGPAYTDALFR